ncbi:MAG: hypothetical protein HDQ87_04395 [Clostridia bacterium]|nr:hypothetical protein [Clostridia bacterium]
MDAYDLLSLVTWVLAGAAGVVAVFWIRSAGTAGLRAALLAAAAAALTALTALAGYRMWLESYAIRSDVFFVSLVFRVLALACCVPGIFLLESVGRGGSRILASGICFLGALTCAVLSLLLMDLLSGWGLAATAAAVLLFCMVFCARSRRLELGRDRAWLTVCAVLAALMVARALVSFQTDMTAGQLLMLAGAALCLVSALWWAVCAFGREALRTPKTCRVFFFCGTLLAALSVSPIFDVSMLYSLT